MSTPVVAVVGTSIAEGSSGTAHECHAVQAANAANIPCVRLGKGGESMGYFTKEGHHRIRYALAAQATDIINEHGVNDFRGLTLAGLMALARLQHSQLAAIDGGRRVYQLTLPPSYASYRKIAGEADWSTVEGQTPSSANAVRAGFNDWVRAGCPEKNGVPVAPGTAGAVPSPFLVGFFDIADVLETARGSGIWIPNYTGDGTHPGAVGHAVAAQVIDMSVVWANFSAAGGGPAPIDPPPPPPVPAAPVVNLFTAGGEVVAFSAN